MVPQEFFVLTAKDIMSRKITVIEPMEKVTTAEIKMIKNNIGGLPVVSPETKELIGIITQRDIQLSRSIIGTNIFHVDDLYSKNPITATEDSPISELVSKMVKHKIERLPIIDENNHVIGMVVNSDIIRALNENCEKRFSNG